MSGSEAGGRGQGDGVLRIGAPLSLSGRYARFGEQAARGLAAWRSLADGAELVVEDDRSDPDTLERVLRDLAGRCDLLLGPYSAGLARRAGRVAVDEGLLLWNHGGSGGPAFPGHVVPVLTPAYNYLAPRVASLAISGMFGSLYFPGMIQVLQGDMPFLDAEIPAANGVATARAIAKMYGAIANGGRIDGRQFLSAERVAGLQGQPTLAPDRNVWVPLSFHLGYHAVPIPGVMPGFGHAGLGGSVGWADPATGMAFAFVHNRLLTPMVFDQATFAGLQMLIRRDAARARRRGYETVPELGAPYQVSHPVAG